MQPLDVDENGNLIYDGVEPIVIRTTDRTNFKKCRRLWNYTSPLGYERAPVRMNYNLAFGIAIHSGLEQFYHPDNFDKSMEIRQNAAITGFNLKNQQQRDIEREASPYGLSDERLQDYRERVELATGMLTNYVKWVEESGEDDGWTPLAVEWKFQVPVVEPGTNRPMLVKAPGDRGMGRPVVYQVRLDLVAEDEQGDVWVWDHKTAGSLEDTAFLDIDTQLSSYLWALHRKLGRPVRGLVYNELVKKVPHKPKVLAKGGLSQDKRQLTTYDLYVESITELGLDPAPYRAMLDYLRANDGGYFRRTPVPRSTSELAIQGRYIYEEVVDMTRADLSLYPNPSKINCRGCDFTAPCTVANEGGDDVYVLNDKMMYTDREKG